MNSWKTYYVNWYQRNKKAQLEYHRAYVLKHSLEIKEYQKKWRERNKKKIQDYYQRHKEKIIKQVVKSHLLRLKLDPKLRLDENFSVQIRQSLKTNKKGRSWENLVGYNLKNLVNRLESQFRIKMNWDNYGSYWVIDHIRPKCLFNYNRAEDPEFKEAWALQNLRPLEKMANLRRPKKLFS